jgi:hypothetical protein
VNPVSLIFAYFVLLVIHTGALGSRDFVDDDTVDDDDDSFSETYSTFEYGSPNDTEGTISVVVGSAPSSSFRLKLMELASWYASSRDLD